MVIFRKSNIFFCILYIYLIRKEYNIVMNIKNILINVKSNILLYNVKNKL
jgi:hypothetical protein